LLIEAIRQLPSTIRNQIHILFVGDGELKSDLERLAEQSPVVKTQFVGFKNQTEISSYYCASDLLVLPSRYGETWGLVVNEALCHGIPGVVSEAVGCAPDLIENGVTGERFDTGSAEALAQTIIRARELIQKPDTAEQCRLRAEQYSMRRAAEGIARAYQEIVSLK
jgi:glycosyltransferase involved in cell wall biosynthesis